MARLLVVQYRSSTAKRRDTLIQLLVPEPGLIPQIGDLIALTRVQKRGGNYMWRALTGTGVYLPFKFGDIEIEVDSYLLETLRLVRKWDVEIAEWQEITLEEVTALRLFNKPKAWIDSLDEKIEGWNTFPLDKAEEPPLV